MLSRCHPISSINMLCLFMTLKIFLYQNRLIRVFLTLYGDNQYINLMAKFNAFDDFEVLVHVYPPRNLKDICFSSGCSMHFFL